MLAMQALLLISISKVMHHANPLLQDSHIPVDYSSITLENMQAAFAHVLQAHENGVERIIRDQRTMPTWDDMVLALDGLDSRLLAVLYAASPLVGRDTAWANAIIDFYGKVTARFEQKNSPTRFCMICMHAWPAVTSASNWMSGSVPLCVGTWTSSPLAGRYSTPQAKRIWQTFKRRLALHARRSAATSTGLG